MQHPSERRLPPRLHQSHLVERLNHVGRIAQSCIPINEHAIAEKFAQCPSVVLNHPLTFRQPRPNHSREFCLRHFAAQSNKVLDVEQEKPTGQFANVAHRRLRFGVIALVIRNESFLDAKGQTLFANLNHVPALQRHWLNNAPAVQMRSVAASKINQRKFRPALSMNQRMSARHFRRCEHHVVVLCPA